MVEKSTVFLLTSLDLTLMVQKSALFEPTFCLYPPALQQELLQVSFLGIYRTTKVPNNFWRLHCYGVTLVKKCNKQQLQISETNNFDQTRYIKDLFKVNEKNNSGVLGINQIMSTLLTLIKRFQLNCYQITAVVCIVALYLNMPSILAYHILHITCSIIV